MDAAGIQTKIYAGYAKASARTGYSFDLFRPTGPANPLANGNKLGSLAASMTPGQAGFSFGKSPAHKDVLFEGLYDGTQTQVGDYLVAMAGEGGQGTFFVANMPSLQPILLVRCNRTLTISAPGPSQTYGLQSTYQGTTPANQAAVMTGWPASLLFDARGRATEVGLPLDLPSPFFTILAPAWPGTDVRTGMVIDDDEGRQYVVSASELTPLGWRVFAQLAVT